MRPTPPGSRRAMSPAPRRCSPPRRRPASRRFVHVCSLAAREPQLSLYGASKARSEALVEASRPATGAIVRPPAVYGPGDRETLELFKMAKRGLVVLPPRGPAVADPCRRPCRGCCSRSPRPMHRASCWSSPTTAARRLDPPRVRRGARPRGRAAACASSVDAARPAHASPRGSTGWCAATRPS